MLVCPNCRHINKDGAKTCEVCHYDLTHVPTEPAKVRARKRKRQTILIVVIAAVIVAGLILFAVFGNYKGSYTLPDWMIERMQHGKVSISASHIRPTLARIVAFY